MRKPSIDLHAVLRLYDEFRDRMYQQSAGKHEVDYSLYAIVAMKLFNFAFNTYKAIGLLLPEHYYEQATGLYRTLWETGANLEWISRQPEQRSHEFLNFTLIEHRNFLQKLTRTAKRNRDANGVIALAQRLAEFEEAVENELTEFQSTDRKGKLRWRRRFSGPTLDEVVKEIAGEWLDEYDRDYPLGSAYTHGAPSGVIFPFHDDYEFTKVLDAERSALTGIMAIHVMIRIDRLWLTLREIDDSQYFSELFFRLRETGTA